MLTQLTCSAGHAWEPANSSSAPLVCPTCGRPPLPSPHDPDPDRTVDTDPDRTIDLPTPTPNTRPSPSEVTQALHFTPLPRSPAAESSATTSRHDAGPRPGAGAAQSPAPTFGGGGGFTIIRQHARGGLGLVNLARDEAIKREVALKQILPQHADNPTLKRRFLYEAQITGQLEHPSIVPVYSLGTDATGSPYYIMRFVRGRNLDTIIGEYYGSQHRNPITLRELLRYFRAICQAVAYAHSRGVIHRDLKPSNIMIGDYGETLVLDWGLAKDIKNKTDPAHFSDTASSTPSKSDNRPADKSRMEFSRITNPELTMEGQIIGTPAYMAPEQAEGRTELHGPVTDIYALGGILYKILCGQSPQAPNASTAGSKTGQRRLTFIQSQAPSKINKEIDPILEKLCLRAMEPDPAARYQRALELADDILRWLDEHPLIFRPTTPTARFRKFLTNNLTPVLILLLLIITLLCALLLRK